MQFSRFGTAALALSALALISAQSAHAQNVTLSYSLSPVAYGSSGNDAYFTLNSRTQNITLTNGVLATANIQGVSFFVNQTTATSDTLLTPISRNITLNGITKSATQNFDLTTDFGDGSSTIYSSDSLTFYPGTTVTFDLGSKGTVDFTPGVLASPLTGEDAIDNFGTAEQAEYVDNLKGRFLYHAAAAPEPSQFAALGLGVFSLGALGLRARQRRSTPAA